MIPPETIGAPALVAYWPHGRGGMGGYVYDATGNANDGSVPVSRHNWQPGRVPGLQRRAASWKLRFDGNDRLRRGRCRETLPDIDKPKIDLVSGSGSTTRWILNRPGDDGGLSSTAGPGPGCVSSFARAELTVDQTTSTTRSSALPAPQLGWHHIAYTFDGNIHTLYLNGGAQHQTSEAMEMPGIATSMVPAEIGPANDQGRPVPDGAVQLGRAGRRSAAISMTCASTTGR